MKTRYCRKDCVEERKFYGNCLEAIGIPDNGIVVVDRNAAPRVGDVVWCTRISGALNTYLKQVKETGDAVLVGTCFNDSCKDIQFYAAEILGVATTILDCDRNVVVQLK